MCFEVYADFLNGNSEQYSMSNTLSVEPNCRQEGKQ